jgi:hypothetical protein
VGRLSLRKEKTEIENKYEIFQKAFADANALLSRQFLKNDISLILYFFLVFKNLA